MLLVNKPSVSQQYNGLKQVSFGDVMMPLIEMFREAILINGNLNKTIFYGWNSRKSTEHKKKSFLVLLKKWIFRAASANKYIIKTNNRNTRKRCEICSKLTRKTTKFPVGYWANGFYSFLPGILISITYRCPKAGHHSDFFEMMIPWKSFE